jgi:competence protein ComEC
LPIAAYYFSEISLVSILANLVLIPICTVSLSVSFIYILTGARFPCLLAIARESANVMLTVCRFITKSPLAYVGTHYRKTLAAAGIFCVAVLVTIALKRNRRSSEITLAASLYLAVCGALLCIKSMPAQDKIIIIPYDGKYTAIVMDGKKALIFNFNCRGKLNYTVDSLVRENNITDSYIFMTSERVYTKMCYESDLSFDAQYLSRDYGDYGITAFGESVQIGDTAVGATDEGFTVWLDGCEITLASSEICVNGTQYAAADFGQTSEILLR